MQMARTIRFDESDTQVFEHAAEPGEWAISGGFEFANWTQEDLTGKKRQAFANGFLSVESLGRSTFVAMAQITEGEIAQLVDQLAEHAVAAYGAPSVDAARPVAQHEIDHMLEMCAEHRPNTLLIVERSLTDAGVHEAFRVIEPSDTTMMDVLGPMADHAIAQSKIDE